MSVRTMLLVGLAAGALLLAPCSNSSSNETTTTGAPSGGDSEVSIENFALGPDDSTKPGAHQSVYETRGDSNFCIVISVMIYHDRS